MLADLASPLMIACWGMSIFQSLRVDQQVLRR
jgi:hypothetical protein